MLAGVGAVGTTPASNRGGSRRGAGARSTASNRSATKKPLLEQAFRDEEEKHQKWSGWGAVKQVCQQLFFWLSWAMLQSMECLVIPAQATL